MKPQSLTLVAIAAALASSSALAEVDVYGKANLSVQNSDEDGVSQVEVKSNNSRFGVKGDAEINDTLKAIYQFEWQVDPDAKGGDGNINARNQFVGLTGAFGTVKVGRHDTALKQAQGDFDLFNDIEGDIKTVLNGENRVANYIGYTTPQFADAFSVTVNLVAGEDPATDNDGIADGTSISFNYEMDNIYAAVAQDMDIDGEGIDTTRVAAGYSFGNFLVNGLYQVTDAGAEDGDAVGASFGYKFGDSLFKVQHISGDIWEMGLADLESSTSIGLDHKLGKSTKVYTFYTTADDGVADSEGYDWFGVGIEHKF